MYNCSKKCVVGTCTRIDNGLMCMNACHLSENSSLFDFEDMTSEEVDDYESDSDME